MKKLHFIVLTALMWILAQVSTAQQSVDLSGTWSFQLDNEKTGVQGRLYNNDLKEQINLPGSTDERGFGFKATEPQKTRLTREYRYVGPAWYQKTIEIPASWQGKHVELFFERAMWETKVWLDDMYIGSQESLCVPHRFNLSDHITPGKHRLTVRIDNRLKINVGHNMNLEGKGWARMWAMSLTEESQTNWNGIIGKMELRISDPVRILRVEAYPDIDKEETRVVVYVKSSVGAVTGEVSVTASGAEHKMRQVTKEFTTLSDEERSEQDPLSPVLGDLSGTYYESRAIEKVELMLPFGEGARLWDEFSPNLYNLKVKLTAKGKKDSFTDEHTKTFGLRKFEADGNRFKLNGRTVFLRGNQDNCIHPKTAYPPMDKESWLDFLQKHKDYGLNCMRFHSWCPPEAAFEAADELGMFVHVEGPVWDGHGNIGYPADRASFVREELDRILREYGNHPSFCMMAIGNEFANHKEMYLQYIVEVMKYQDNRHLYTAACHPADTSRNDDFHVAAGGFNGLWARGLTPMEGDTEWDYEKAIRDYREPFISHEIGQYTSFPDFYTWFDEEKYTGPLKAKYIGLFREKFEQFHPPARGSEFAKASGAVQLLQYKTEIEAMLRTPSMAGFHLNGLMDYPGEGVALIGMLDAMGESKGIVSPEIFHQFCSETVPLVRLPSLTFNAGDEFTVPVMVRHHGVKDLVRSEWSWSISNRDGKLVDGGFLCKYDVTTGELTELGSIRTRLPELKQPEELTLQVWMENSDVRNEWQIWIYPAAEPETPSDVLIAGKWTPEVKEKLKAGGKVMIIPSKEDLQNPVDIRFGTVFWGRGLFPDLMRPMGIYCDPAQPALSEFPTREYSGWQWYDLLTDAYAITLNSLPFEYEPIVYIIDDFNESHRLGTLVEAKVGKGSLLISTLNLGKTDERSLAQKQMLKSLLDYAGSDRFSPSQSLTVKQLDGLFTNK
ncbi:MAG: hypothetical protein IH594_03630 [Bacteroidales bacterium]|nr:hypothetical protein [Bacteroidales bacterium]